MQLFSGNLPAVVLAAACLPCTVHAEPIGIPWPQPNGRGSEVVLTYSFSNLLDGTFMLVDGVQLRAATVEALGVWAAHAPIRFVERPDSGPPPSDDAYEPMNHPRIRIGHHTMMDLGHSFFPNTPDGRAGDVHLDSSAPWAFGDGRWNLLEVLVHELGHALGLVHIDSEPAIMNPFFPQARFSTLGTTFLLPPDIAMLQAMYGAGTGSVEPVPEPATLLLVGAGLSLIVRHRVRRRSVL